MGVEREQDTFRLMWKAREAEHQYYNIILWQIGLEIQRKCVNGKNNYYSNKKNNKNMCMYGQVYHHHVSVTGPILTVRSPIGFDCVCTGIDLLVQC